MANVDLGMIMGSGLDLIPHIEEAAIFYITRAYVMQQRVTVFNDMEGFNPRKVSEYLLPQVAEELAEATDIPESVLYRTRRSQIDIKEVGDRYLLTDRRVQTDLENIVADTAFTLAKAVGDKVEIDLINEAVNSFKGGTLGSAATDYSVDLPIAMQFEFAKRNGATNRGQLYHVIHPFQAAKLMRDLVNYGSGTVNLDWRNSAINGWRVPGFDGLDIVQSSFLPRNVNNRLVIDGTGGTFRLSVKGLTTGAITVSATPATTATNIKNALDALAIGTWTVADASGGTNNLDIDVTPPAALYVHADEELAVAVSPTDPTLEAQKSAYDLVTTPTGLAGTDQFGVAYGVAVQERSASVKSLMFYRPALALDIRQSPTAHYDTLHQGRTAEYSLYMKYGTGEWMPHLGAFIHTAASSPLAIA